MRLSQIFQKEQSTLTSLTLNNLKHITFLEIIKKQQYVLLDKDYSEKKKYSEKDLLFLKQSWEQLQDDVFTLENSREYKAFLQKSIDKMLLIEKIRLIENYAKLLIWLSDKHFLYAELEKENEFREKLQSIYAQIVAHDKRIKIKYFDPINVNLKTLERVILSLINEYNTKHKDIEEKVTKAEKSIFYDVHQVNMITGLKLSANEMYCAEWIEAKKIAMQINNERSKKQGNGI